MEVYNSYDKGMKFVFEGFYYLEFIGIELIIFEQNVYFNDGFDDVFE